ncbi:hypothetical protein HANVADRAFT_52752, partial [Hanseniaspora valbyensis NRRL Y-1626]
MGGSNNKGFEFEEFEENVIDLDIGSDNEFDEKHINLTNPNDLQHVITKLRHLDDKVTILDIEVTDYKEKLKKIKVDNERLKADNMKLKNDNNIHIAKIGDLENVVSIITKDIRGLSDYANGISAVVDKRRERTKDDLVNIRNEFTSYIRTLESKIKNHITNTVLSNNLKTSDTNNRIEIYSQLNNTNEIKTPDGETLDYPLKKMMEKIESHTSTTRNMKKYNKQYKAPKLNANKISKRQMKKERKNSLDQAKFNKINQSANSVYPVIKNQKTWNGNI